MSKGSTRRSAPGGVDLDIHIRVASERGQRERGLLRAASERGQRERDLLRVAPERVLGKWRFSDGVHDACGGLCVLMASCCIARRVRQHGSVASVRVQGTRGAYLLYSSATYFQYLSPLLSLPRIGSLDFFSSKHLPAEGSPLHPNILEELDQWDSSHHLANLCHGYLQRRLLIQLENCAGKDHHGSFLM